MIEPNTTAAEPSIADLRLMVGETPEPEPAKTPAVEAAPEPKTEAPEVKADEGAAPGPAETKDTEAESGTAATEPEATEEELPEGVKKRIAKEVKEQGRLDRLITEAVSSRKAKEAELAKLTADKSGSEPAPTPAPAATDGKPVRPDLETFQGTYAEYQSALNKYDADHEAWLVAKTERAAEEKWTARQRDEAMKRDWDEATEKHGAEFPEHMKTLAAGSPEGLQLAISGLDNWAGVAVHLAENPAELKSLSQKFAANPYAAVAELGRLEDRLQQASKPTPEPAKVAAPAKAAKPLPTPPAKPGGAATATASVDLEKADMRTFKREVAHLLDR